MEALKHPRHWHNNRIYSSLYATTDTNPWQFTPTCTHITAHRRPHGRNSRRIDVSTCLPITDCNGIVDREGGRSFSFGRPSYFSFPHMFASFASCNIVPHSSFYTHRSTSPSSPSSSFSVGTNPTVCCCLSFSFVSRWYFDQKGSL